MGIFSLKFFTPTVAAGILAVAVLGPSSLGQIPPDDLVTVPDVDDMIIDASEPIIDLLGPTQGNDVVFDTPPIVWVDEYIDFDHVMNFAKPFQRGEGPLGLNSSSLLHFNLIVLMGFDESVYPDSLEVAIRDNVSQAQVWKSESFPIIPMSGVVEVPDVPYAANATYEVILDSVDVRSFDLLDPTPNHDPETCGAMVIPPFEWGETHYRESYDYDGTSVGVDTYSIQDWSQRHEYYNCDGDIASSVSYFVGYQWEGDIYAQHSASNAQSLNYWMHFQGSEDEGDCSNPPPHPTPYPGEDPGSCWERYRRVGSRIIVREARAFVNPGSGEVGMEFPPAGDGADAYGFAQYPTDCSTQYGYNAWDWAGIGASMLSAFTSTGPWGAALTFSGLGLSLIPSEEQLCEAPNETIFETDGWGRSGKGVAMRIPTGNAESNVRGHIDAFYTQSGQIYFDTRGSFSVLGVGRADDGGRILTYHMGWGWGASSSIKVF